MGADVGVLRVYQYLPDVFLGRYYATLHIDLEMAGWLPLLQKEIWYGAFLPTVLRYFLGMKISYFSFTS